MAEPDLFVEADGPLSVRCGACKETVGGTVYPTVTFHLRTLEALQRIHAKRCKPEEAGRG